MTKEENAEWYKKSIESLEYLHGKFKTNAVIESNKWDEIFKEFAKVDFFNKIKQYEMYDAFADWIEINYFAPEKKKQ